MGFSMIGRPCANMRTHRSLIVFDTDKPLHKRNTQQLQYVHFQDVLPQHKCVAISIFIYLFIYYICFRSVSKSALITLEGYAE